MEKPHKIKGQEHWQEEVSRESNVGPKLQRLGDPGENRPKAEEKGALAIDERKQWKAGSGSQGLP